MVLVYKKTNHKIFLKLRGDCAELNSFQDNKIINLFGVLSLPVFVHFLLKWPESNHKNHAKS